MYHDFLEEASHHRFEGQGYLHEKPDLVLLANPGLDFFFDCWAPTVKALRDAAYFTGASGLILGDASASSTYTRTHLI